MSEFQRNVEADLAMCEAATSEPWKALLKSRGMTGVHAADCVIYHASFDPGCLPETHEQQKADATFIALARPAMPEYIREVQRLRAIETELRAALELAQKWLANSVPVEDIQGPKPLPVIAATLAKNSEAST